MPFFPVGTLLARPTFEGLGATAAWLGRATRRRHTRQARFGRRGRRDDDVQGGSVVRGINTGLALGGLFLRKPVNMSKNNLSNVLALINCRAFLILVILHFMNYLK